MIRFFLFSFFYLLLHQGNAQFAVKGQIADQQSPLAYSSFYFTTLDSTFVKGDISDLDGRFQTQLAAGDYRLHISYLGYEPLVREIVVAQDVDLGPLVLEVWENELEEITVRAQKQLFERKADRLVINISKSIAAQGADMSELIRMAPGVLVQNEAISMVGRGEVRVMIDGRPVNLSGEELIGYLSGIPADDIEKIEVIHNPPARYDAAGNAGLINIIYKKGRQNSWSNQTTAAYDKNKYGFWTLGNRFNYRKNKTSLALSLNGHQGARWEREYGTTTFAEGRWEWDSQTRARRDDLSGRIALDYQLTDRISIGSQYMTTRANPDIDGLVTNLALNSRGEIDSTLINDGLSERKRKTDIVNLHLVADLDSNGYRLSVDLDYFDYQNDLSRRFVVNSFDAAGYFLGLHRARYNLSTQGIKNYNAKFDLEQPTRFADLSYGARYSLVESDNVLEDYNTISGGAVFDSSLSNVFNYRERISAFYLSASKSLGREWSAQLGLRLEHTQTKGFSASLDQSNSNQYARLFPSAFLQYQPNEEHNVSLSMGSRINRPGFRNLNPFRIYLTNLSYSEGNPFLQASFTNTYNLNYVYKGQYTTQAFINHTTNGHGTLFTAEETSQVQAVLRANYFNELSMGIGELFSLRAGKWLTSQNQIFLVFNQTTIYEEFKTPAQNGAQLYFASNNTVSLPKSWFVQADFWYNSPHRSNIFYIGDTYSLDLSIKKSFLADKLQVSLHAADLLNTASLDELRSSFNGVGNRYGQNYSSRHVRMTISYSFGNEQVKVSKRAFGNEEERSRS